MVRKLTVAKLKQTIVSILVFSVSRTELYWQRSIVLARAWLLGASNDCSTDAKELLFVSCRLIDEIYALLYCYCSGLKFVTAHYLNFLRI